MKNIFKILFIAALFISCEEDDELSCEPPFVNVTLDAYSIDGNVLPYTESFGEGNSLRYNSITLNVMSDGTWTSTVRSTQTVSGNSNSVVVDQMGTWACNNAVQEIAIIDDEGDEGGVLGYTISVAQTTTGAIREYRIRLNNISSEVLFFYDEPL